MSKRQYRQFNCIECGDEFTTRSDYVKKMSGRCRACANIEAGRKRRTHGLNNANSRLHVTWANMKRRCLNPTKKEKVNYTGVSLFAYWYEFLPFMEWAQANGYSDDKTIDRIDGSKGYSPENCRFVDYSYQSANRKNTGKNKWKYIGVFKYKNKWGAKIQWRGKQIYLGTYSGPEQAAAARNQYIIDNGLPHTLDDIKEITRKYKAMTRSLKEVE